MSSEVDKPDITSALEEIRSKYSCCDVSDALLNLKVPSAGMLKDISPIPTRLGSTTRIVAPISTVVFVNKAHKEGDEYEDIVVPKSSNLPSDKHFSDVAAPGTVVIMQQPHHQIAALLGDIVGTRYKARGVLGVVTDGRMRDVIGCEELCKQGNFTSWTKAYSCVGTSIEAKPWAVDVPLQIGKAEVKPGDIIVADEGEMMCCVIPREKLDEVMQLLPVQKEADEGLLSDVKNGLDFRSAIKRWPNHYSTTIRDLAQ